MTRSRARTSPRDGGARTPRDAGPTPRTPASRSAPRSRPGPARSSPAATSRTRPTASTLCAERVAVFKAVSEGLTGFEAIAVVADSKHLTAPCGPCRQILWEFCGDILVHMSNCRGARASCACASCCRCPSTGHALSMAAPAEPLGAPAARKAAIRGAAGSTRSRPSGGGAAARRGPSRDRGRRARGALDRPRRAPGRRHARRAAATSCLLGAGTSGRLAVLEAAECPPTFGVGPAPDPRRDGGRPRVRVPGARGLARIATTLGREEGGRLGPDDLLVGISASSVTPFVRGALGAARVRGARTVLVTCAPGGASRAWPMLVIAVRSGPEVLTGWTRLKAGSATKAVLERDHHRRDGAPREGLREPDGRPEADVRRSSWTASAASSPRRRAGATPRSSGCSPTPMAR